MTARRSQHLNVNGEPKASYATASGGWKYINHLIEQGAVPEGYLRAYECPRCGKYHVGKQPRTVRHRRDRRGAW